LNAGNQAGASSFAAQPHFLDTSSGRIFAVHHAPASPRGHVLFVPPFNEEMNRCRSMMTLQAESLFRCGFGTLVVDLFGTGDSDGDYVDARWELWLDNVTRAFRHIRTLGSCVSVIGIRLGAVLAAEWLDNTRDDYESPRGFVAWQPIVDGKQYFTQFLRMRIAAAMERQGGPKETTATLRATLAGGTPIEVGGYEIHPSLASAIERRSMDDTCPPAECRVAWMEQRVPGIDGPAPASVRVMAAWKSRGVEIEEASFDGQAFWQLHERAVAEDLVARTTRWISSHVDVKA